MLRVVCSRVYPYPVNRSPCQASCPLHMSAGSRGGSRRENLFNFTPRPPSSSRNVCETQGVFPTSYRNCLPEQKILSFSKAFILIIRDYVFFIIKIFLVPYFDKALYFLRKSYNSYTNKTDSSLHLMKE